jgi:hypothetical protein
LTPNPSHEAEKAKEAFENACDALAAPAATKRKLVGRLASAAYAFRVAAFFIH